MKCEICGKKKDTTFSRTGGLIPGEIVDVLRPKRRKKGQDVDVNGFVSVCLTCIKSRQENGTWLPSRVITNPTIIPSGDPLEWVLNEE